MSVYTVHEPPQRGADASADAERFVFVRDGFYWWAFLLTPFWMLRHRLWLVLVIYLVVVGGLDTALRRRRRVGLRHHSRRPSASRCWSGLKPARCGASRCAAGVGEISASSAATILKMPSGGFSISGSATRSPRGGAPRIGSSPPRPRRPLQAIRQHPASSACFPNRERSGERRHRRLRLRQSAFGRESVRARGARSRAWTSRSVVTNDPADGGARRSRGAAGRRRLCRLPARARRGRRHGRGAGRGGPPQRPAVLRHLRRHAAPCRARPRIRSHRRSRLDCRRGRSHRAERSEPEDPAHGMEHAQCRAAASS